MAGIRGDALELIKKGKVKVAMTTPKNVIIEVGDETVIIKKLAGRSIITCSCKSYSMFPKEPAICKHRLAAQFLWMMQGTRLEEAK